MIHDRRYTGSFFQQQPRCGASEEPILVSREKERKKDTACIIIIVSAPPGRGRWRVTRTGIWLDRESKSILSRLLWIADGRTGGPWWDAVDQPTQQVSLNHAMCSQPTPPQNHPPLSTRGPVVVGHHQQQDLPPRCQRRSQVSPPCVRRSRLTLRLVPRACKEFPKRSLRHIGHGRSDSDTATTAIWLSREGAARQSHMRRGSA